MSQKYELFGIPINWGPHLMFQIRSLSSFSIHGHNVCPGDLGGYVDSEHVLSQEGRSWIRLYCMVIGSRIEDDSLISAYYGNGTQIESIVRSSIVKGSSLIVGSKILDKTTVVDSHCVKSMLQFVPIVKTDGIIFDSVIKQNVEISGNPSISGSEIRGRDPYNPIRIFGDARIVDCHITGSPWVFGDQVLRGQTIDDSDRYPGTNRLIRDSRPGIIKMKPRK